MKTSCQSIEKKTDRSVFTSTERRVCRLRERGFSARKISELTGMSTGSIYVHLSRAGGKGWVLPEKAREILRRDHSSRNQAVIEMVRRGKSTEEIRERLGMSADAVYVHVSKARKRGTLAPEVRASGLTGLERAVWTLSNAGKSTSQIARELGITTNAVYVHRCNARKKGQDQADFVPKYRM